jgi:GNAT superfamily N-acetyltransferase
MQRSTHLTNTAISFRRAAYEDVPAIVRMLADDALGARRERYTDPLPDSYYLAYTEIERDPNNELIVAEANDAVVAVLQLTYISSLSHQGACRALVEGVRVDGSVRGQGVGHRLLEHAIGRARARNCRMVQLTTDKQRPDAHRFYEDLGFVASHVGMKLHLESAA